MGAQPKPIEAKLLAGNPGKRPLPAPIAVVPGLTEIPDPPAHLDVAGRRFWDDVWVACHAWISPEIDYGVVETVSKLYDECADYESALVEHGALIEEPINSATGKIVGTRQVANPAAKMLRQARAELERWLVLLAIPPTARARLGLVQVKTQSTLEELLARRAHADHVIDVEDWGED
jgi:P27 family predicted phage terminase small subunit